MTETPASTPAKEATSSLPPGGLPAWSVADLPPPLPFSFRNAIKTIGPGAILLAGSIGGGEWIIGPLTAIKHGAGILWIASVAVVLQTLFNMEAVRYTMVTGEPIFTGFMRLRPNSRFWSLFYIAIGIAQLSVPALALGCAGVLFSTAVGRTPAADDFWPLHYIAYGVIILGVILLQSGKKVEAVLEWLSWWMVLFIFAFLIVVNALFVKAEIWQQTLGGFLFFDPAIPRDMDLILLAAFAATAGSGGLGNLAVSNWYRDKGFGMGQRMGSIAGMLESHETPLRPIGFQPPDNAENRSRWRHWWKYAICDQAVLWGPGCLIGMLLNVNIAMSIIPRENAAEFMSQANVVAGAFQAHHLADKIWSGFWYLTLLNGFWILFSTHLGNTDVLVRTIVDICWTSSPRARRGSAGRLYTLVLAVLTVWGLIAVNMGDVLQLFTVLAVVANPVLAIGAVQILLVNRRFLPREMQPPWWRQLALVLVAIAYSLVTAAVLYDKFLK
ncbi:MAG: Nramp family divalent metal transporter [Planctomycetaceae bacterium]